MKRDQRRRQQRYRNGIEASDLLKLTCQTTIGPLLGFLEQNLGEHETLSVHSWVDEFFYIEVIDSRFRAGPSFDSQIAGMRIGLTVDVLRDRIVWSNIPYRPNTSQPARLPLGGNCYVRANKWKRLVRERFNQFDLGFRIYKNVNPPNEN